jgi:hypothetical protein
MGSYSQGTYAPIPGGSDPATRPNQLLQITEAELTNERIGAIDETAPTTDTGDSGLNGRLQRIAQNIATQTTDMNADNGTDATDPVQMAAGTGIRGWLSGIYHRLNQARTNTTAPFTQITDGTNNGTVKAASTVVADADTALVVTNRDPVKLANLHFTGTATLSAINTDLLTGTVNGWYDLKDYRNISVTIMGSAGITAGQVIFEQSGDTTVNPNGTTVPVIYTNSLSLAPVVGPITIAANSTTSVTLQSNYRYIRARISTAFAGGTVRAIASASTQNLKENLLMTGAMFNTTPPTLADGQFAPLQSNGAGGLIVAQSNVGSLPRGLHSRFRNTALTNTVVTVKSSKGNIYGINIINPNTVPAYVKLFDSSTATLGTTAPVRTIVIGATSAYTVENTGAVWEYFQNNSIKAVAVSALADNTITAPTTPLLIEMSYV